MGGFTKIVLEDTSEDNIIRANCLLDMYKVSKNYRFYSKHDVKVEYHHYCIGNGEYPENLFPSKQIHSFEDFTKFWNHNKIPYFVPDFGVLTFDCYFSRTPKIQMKRIANFLLDHPTLIRNVGGSFETFVERCGKYSHLKKQLLKFKQS